MNTLEKRIIEELDSHKKTIEAIIGTMETPLEKASMLMIETLKNGNKILLCGNGGSAADAQHIAAELTGRYKTQRKALAAIALTTDTSALTAIANDFSYAKIFERQIEALANEGDLLLAISTSGNSENILRALEKAQDLGCKILGFSGHNGGKMHSYCTINLVVPSDNTPRIQEMHILFGHILCHTIDEAF
jgi:D-sedoheptulose 7-phosphate isomerase